MHAWTWSSQAQQANGRRLHRVYLITTSFLKKRRLDCATPQKSKRYRRKHAALHPCSRLHTCDPTTSHSDVELYCFFGVTVSIRFWMFFFLGLYLAFANRKKTPHSVFPLLLSRLVLSLQAVPQLETVAFEFALSRGGSSSVFKQLQVSWATALYFTSLPLFWTCEAIALIYIALCALGRAYTFLFFWRALRKLGNVADQVTAKLIWKCTPTYLIRINDSTWNTYIYI